MKTVDVPVQVPDWVTRIAQDKSGDWFMYENRPISSKDYWVADGGKWETLVLCCEPNPNWRETLREVE